MSQADSTSLYRLAMTVEVLVLSGSMGSGKTTVMAEASDILIAGGVAHAALDLDALGIVHLRRRKTDDLARRNLAAVWRNYAKAGVRKLLLAEALESVERRDHLRQAIPSSHIVVCRLRAPLDVMRKRVRARERGLRQAEFVKRVAELEATLDFGHVDDFEVDNGDRPVTTVAREVLRRAGWIQ